MTTMTAGQLRQALRAVPDSTPVLITGDANEETPITRLVQWAKENGHPQDLFVIHTEGDVPKEDTTYQGWTNYETWAVALWLNNEPHTHTFLRRIARDILTGYEAGRADYLKDWVEAYYLLSKIDSLAGDLITHALGQVNWREIIDAAKED
jgi:hypothetical protein